MTIARFTNDKAILGPMDLDRAVMYRLKEMAEKKGTTVRALVRRALAELVGASRSLQAAEKAAGRLQDVETGAGSSGAPEAVLRPHTPRQRQVLNAALGLEAWPEDLSDEVQAPKWAKQVAGVEPESPPGFEGSEAERILRAEGVYSEEYIFGGSSGEEK